jgi:hypothetical protein
MLFVIDTLSTNVPSTQTTEAFSTSGLGGRGASAQTYSLTLPTWPATTSATAVGDKFLV